MPTDLEILMSKFSRRGQGKKSGRVPNHLKQRVIELCQHYDAEEVASRLGLRKATLKRWQESTYSTTKTSGADHVDFISLAPFQESSKHRPKELSLTIELSNGIKLLLSGQNALELVELTRDLAKRLNT